MLFNSIEFLTIFLPSAVALFYFLSWRVGHGAALSGLLIASLVFYSYWNPPFLLLILLSIAANFWVSSEFDRPGNAGRRKLLLFSGILFNLGLLGFFKYVNFFISTAELVTDLGWKPLDVFLPLGISFYTFQQIAFLVDRYRGEAGERSLRDYALFVSFFPQLIAGPIVHHNQVMPQFRSRGVTVFHLETFMEGVIIFLLGLAKKVVLADPLGAFADPAFAAAEQGMQLSFLEAWGGALAYTLQLYFDFSGYSDMAIGLGLMFNIRLPINFFSPYRATSIVDFWRRWHITLSTFLRDYLYIPLGGNRAGRRRRHVNLMLTMLLGGLWHGAGWTFVAWGGLHGLYLVVNHLWSMTRLGRRLAYAPGAGFLGWLITFLAVVLGWVLFRAESFSAAIEVYRGMAGANGVVLPEQILHLLPPLRAFAEGQGNLSFFGGGMILGFIEAYAMIALGLVVCLAFPNLYQMSWNARLLLVLLTFALTAQRVFFSTQASPFLYFQF